MWLVDSVANVIVGYGVAVVTQILKMGAVFTVVSIPQSYVLRRLFEAVRLRSTK